jgi:hypothetical protein
VTQTVDAGARSVNRVARAVARAAMRQTNLEIKVFVHSSVAVVIDPIAQLTRLFRDNASILTAVFSIAVEVVKPYLTGTHRAALFAAQPFGIFVLTSMSTTQTMRRIKSLSLTSGDLLRTI